MTQLEASEQTVFPKLFSEACAKCHKEVWAL